MASKDTRESGIPIINLGNLPPPDIHDPLAEERITTQFSEIYQLLDNTALALEASANILREEGRAPKLSLITNRRHTTWSVKETKGKGSLEYASKLVFATVKRNPRLELYEVTISEKSQEHQREKSPPKLVLNFKKGKINQLTLSVHDIFLAGNPLDNLIPKFSQIFHLRNYL